MKEAFVKPAVNYSIRGVRKGRAGSSWWARDDCGYREDAIRTRQGNVMLMLSNNQGGVSTVTSKAVADGLLLVHPQYDRRWLAYISSLGSQQWKISSLRSFEYKYKYTARKVLWIECA